MVVSLGLMNYPLAWRKKKPMKSLVRIVSVNFLAGNVIGVAANLSQNNRFHGLF